VIRVEVLKEVVKDTGAEVLGEGKAGVVAPDEHLRHFAAHEVEVCGLRRQGGKEG